MTPRNTQFSREDIIGAAFDMVRQNGWSGFSVQAVGKAINASTMPIYSQFASVRELEDAVCEKGIELLKERLLQERSGDRWIDHGVNWVRFADEERNLYRCLWDGRNPDQQKKLGGELVQFIDAELADYPLFSELSPGEFRMIRLSRMLFVQKLAFWINRDRNFTKDLGIDVDDFIRRTSMALYDGFMLQFRGGSSKTT